MAGESYVIPSDFIFLFTIWVLFFFMIQVDPSPILFYFYFFIRSELVRVDPSWSDPDWWSELIRSNFCTCLFRNVLFSSVFVVFLRGRGGGGGYIFLEATTHSVPKNQNSYFEDFFKNENLTKICFKMIFYKDHHRMITPNSNIFQRQYNIDPMPHNLFWNQESRISKNSVKTMKEWLKPLTVR